MRHVQIEAVVPDADADAVFDRIGDFARYRDYTDAVREVTVIPGIDGMLTSHWSVYFRNGLLCWSERDVFDHAGRTITFEQLDGDFEELDGHWAITPLGSDVRVVFTAVFDLGMPSLAAIIDPIAERTLRDNMHKILSGLLGADVVFLDSTELAEPGTALP